MWVQLNTEGWAKTYVIADPIKREALLIDSVHGNEERDLAWLEKYNLTCKAVINTHTHADHISSGFILSERLNVPYLMHENTKVASANYLVKEGHKISVGDIELLVMHAPGHTPDSIIIHGHGLMITGDSLFGGAAGVGRDDLPGGNIESHWSTLQKIKTLDFSLLVLSGHEPPGAPIFTLGETIKLSDPLNLTDIESYKKWQENEWIKLGKVSKIDIALPANLSCSLPVK